MREREKRKDLERLIRKEFRSRDLELEKRDEKR